MEDRGGHNFEVGFRDDWRAFSDQSLIDAALTEAFGVREKCGAGCEPWEAGRSARRTGWT
jgi:hypothetical protein